MCMDDTRNQLQLIFDLICVWKSSKCIYLSFHCIVLIVSEICNKLQNQISRLTCRTAKKPQINLKPLAHHGNVASLSLFWWYYFGNHLNWIVYFHLFFLKGGLLVILIDCMIFLSTFLELTLEFSAYRILSFDLWS